MTDVLVIGFGVAGASAAIAAHDAGARVTICERTSAGGGNARYAGGFLLEADVARLEALCFGKTPRDVLTAYADGMAELHEWVDFGPGPFPPSWPHLPGSARIHQAPDLFGQLQAEVEKRGIEVRYDTRVTEFDGRPTILACGGFEYDAEMRDAYLPIPLVAVGHSGNTGDAVRIAQAAGASLWHMSAFFGWYAFRHPDYEAAFPLDVHAPSFINVDADGRRFTDEHAWEVHDRLRALTVYDPRRANRPALPGYLIFDEPARLAGPLNGIVGTPNDYVWSPDNAREIENGWIVPVATLNLPHLETDLEPPLWAIETWPAVATASGGPRRNARAQVLRPDGTPIPNLYAAGGAGSVWGHLTDHGGGLTDALVFGRIAGAAAATL